MDPLERKLGGALRDAIVTSTRDLGYQMPMLPPLIDRLGPVGAVRHLLLAPTVSEGFTKLFMLGRPDLSVEAIVLDHPEFAALFSEEELAIARGRLGR